MITGKIINDDLQGYLMKQGANINNLYAVKSAIVTFINFLKNNQLEEIEIDQTIINQYKAYLLDNYSNMSASQIIAKLNRMLKSNYSINLECTLPMQKNPITKEDLEEILAYLRINKRNRLLVKLLSCTGLNTLELLNITVKEAQEMKLDDEAKLFLKEYLEELPLKSDMYLFINLETNKPIIDRNVRATLKRIAKALGKDPAVIKPNNFIRYARENKK